MPAGGASQPLHHPEREYRARYLQLHESRVVQPRVRQCGKEGMSRAFPLCYVKGFFTLIRFFALPSVSLEYMYRLFQLVREAILFLS